MESVPAIADFDRLLKNGGSEWPGNVHSSSIAPEQSQTAVIRGWNGEPRLWWQVHTRREETPLDGDALAWMVSLAL